MMNFEESEGFEQNIKIQNVTNTTKGFLYAKIVDRRRTNRRSEKIVVCQPSGETMLLFINDVGKYDILVKPQDIIRVSLRKVKLFNRWCAPTSCHYYGQISLNDIEKSTRNMEIKLPVEIDFEKLRTGVESTTRFVGKVCQLGMFVTCNMI